MQHEVSLAAEAAVSLLSPSGTLRLFGWLLLGIFNRSRKVQKSNGRAFTQSGCGFKSLKSLAPLQAGGHR